MSEETIIPTTNPQDLSLDALIEALLFVSPSPVTAKQMGHILGVTPRVVEKALRILEDNLKTRGIRIQKNRGRYQFTTAPETASLLEGFLNLDITSKLSKAAMETLAIIAYQQPLTRPLVDSIRGVNSDSVIKTLLSNGLIEEVGRSEGPGRPIFYATSPEFLQHFGLSSLTDLPALSLPYERDEPAEEYSQQPKLALGTEILKE
jgi:segregation and condensation protein B